MEPERQIMTRSARTLREMIYARYRSRYAGDEESSPATLEWKRRVFLPYLDGLAGSARIVELGCGGGELLSIVRDAGWTEVQGVDVSPEQVERARRRGVAVDLGDALEFLSRQERPIDCIIAVDFLEHMTRDELAALLPLIRSALRPNGRLIVQTMNAAGVNGARVAYGDLTHMTLFTESSIEQLLRAYDFTYITIEETGPRAIGLKGTIRVLLWHTLRAIPKFLAYIESGSRQRVWTANLVCSAVKGQEPPQGQGLIH